MNRKVLRKRDKYFELVTGIEEKYLMEKYGNGSGEYNNIIKKMLIFEGKECIINGNKKYRAGNLDILSIGELREKTKKLNKKGGGSFSVVIGYNTDFNSIYRDKVDIAALQTNEKNKDAVFQIASNFSGLEPICKTDIPENGISKYIYDNTQGPIASISAAPGLIYRMYGIFNNNTNQKDWRQKNNNQINLLHNVSSFYPVVNGYVDLSLCKYLNRPTQNLIDLVEIAFHHNIQTCYGLSYGSDHEVCLDNSQIINQIFTSSIDLGKSSGNTNYLLFDQYPGIVTDLTQVLLDAAYEGTIRSCWLFDKQTLYLTLIGGGVFNNSLSWIAQSLEKLSSLIIDSGITITLVIYNYQHLLSHGSLSVDSFIARIKDLTVKTDGIFTLYQ